MIKLLRNWHILYWTAGIIFLAVDLSRCLAIDYAHDFDRPFALPAALVLVGLRAAADLFILTGLFLILSHVLAEITTNARTRLSRPQTHWTQWRSRALSLPAGPRQKPDAPEQSWNTSERFRSERNCHD